MKVKININGKETEIVLTTEQLEKIKNIHPMEEVYAFHNTTEEEFEKLYMNVSKFSKYQEVEAMVVNFYNKGEKPDWNNGKQTKYIPYFRLGDNFSYHYCSSWSSSSHASARLFFLRLEDLKDAVVKFLPQYKNSRNN